MFKCQAITSHISRVNNNYMQNFRKNRVKLNLEICRQLVDCKSNCIKTVIKAKGGSTIDIKMYIFVDLNLI